MAESPEHGYISNAFLSALESLARSRLYGYTEANRKMFDLACGLERDWKRLLVGQTLWKHSEGISKDLLYLLTEDSASAVVYLARHTSRNQRDTYQLLDRMRRSELASRLHRVRVIWVPSDFDADDESKRAMLKDHLRDAVANDILLNVLFGRLSALDVRFFLASAGIPGLLLAALYVIAKEGFVNYPQLAQRLNVSASTLRPRVAALVTAGFLWTLPAMSLYYVSARGRVFLDICHELVVAGDRLGPELAYILGLLELDVDLTAPITWSIEHWASPRPDHRAQRLRAEIRYAMNMYGVKLEGPPYQVNDDELTSTNLLLR
jgi:hypothetical protein